MNNLTPDEIVKELDKVIIGQTTAKNAIAVAFRDRYRRMQLSDKDKKWIVTRNILLKGPSGVAKTEIARMIAELCDFPFIKIDATSITSRGYIGGKMGTHIKRFVQEGERKYHLAVKKWQKENMKDEVFEIEPDTIGRMTKTFRGSFPKTHKEFDTGFKLLVDFANELKVGDEFSLKGTIPLRRRITKMPFTFEVDVSGVVKDKAHLQSLLKGLCLFLMQSYSKNWQVFPLQVVSEYKGSGKDFYKELLHSALSLDSVDGLPSLEEHIREYIDVDDNRLEVITGQMGKPGWNILDSFTMDDLDNSCKEIKNAEGDLEQHIRNWISADTPRNKAKGPQLPKELSSPRAYVENFGVVFIDEIDKLAMTNGKGHNTTEVQTELLKLIEGGDYDLDQDNGFRDEKSGILKTDNILFICAGAFVETSEEGIIPELRGRLPITIALEPLSEDNLYDIMTKSAKSPLLGIQKLLEVDGIDLSFSESGLRALARMAYRYNTMDVNLGARRLQQIISLVISKYSYVLPIGERVKIRLDEISVVEAIKEFYDNNEHVYELSNHGYDAERWATFIYKDPASPIHVERIKRIHSEEVSEIKLETARILGGLVYAAFAWADEPKVHVKRFFEVLYEGEGELGNLPKYVNENLKEFLPMVIGPDKRLVTGGSDKVAMGIIMTLVGKERLQDVLGSELPEDK